MGRSHALAYHRLAGFEICGIVTRSPESRAALNAELGGGYAEFGDFHEALATTKPDAVSISTYPDTHAPYAEAKARLLELPGVGEKVADCVLLFGAGRLEALA